MNDDDKAGEAPARGTPDESTPKAIAAPGSGQHGAPAEGPAEARSGAWNGEAAQVPPPADTGSAGTGGDKATDSEEESLEYDSKTSRIRLDFPAGGQFRDVAGEIHYHYDAKQSKTHTPGRISVADLQHAFVAHVTTPSDAELRERIDEQHVVFCRGAPGTGRSQSVTVALDHVTRYSRDVSKVIVLDSVPGLAGLLDQLEAGCGHMLDGSEASWTEAISRAQLNQAREALGPSGYLVILVETDSGPLAGTAVDHLPPELGRVAAFQLAARFLENQPPDRAAEAAARARARSIIEDACQADAETSSWYAELTSAPTSGPAEAVLFAEAVWDWHRRKAADPQAVPRTKEFRSRQRYEQASRLLRRSDHTDSPLRQSFAISGAVLDGLALNEVIDGAGKLAALLAEVEHPGAPGQRQVFAHPVARWLRHVEMGPPAPGSGDGGTLVKMPSRELARVLIELAWREYDAARVPVLSWLMALCEQHRDHRVRIRAVQALAFIAAHDYPLIKERVLDVWSARDSRPVEQLAASWLLEAIVLDGTSADKVRDLLRHWSRSPESSKRGVAVRAYGTSVASSDPGDAVQGIRISAVLPDLGSLPELALREMYLLRLTGEVTTELALWMYGFPMMRTRAGRVLVRISQLRRLAEGESDGPYDLLWLLAHDPGKVGVSLQQLAKLWLLACSHESSRSAAWQMLGRWAQSCRKYPGLSSVFATLTDEFEKVAGDDDLAGRLRVYRRRWNSYLNEDEEKQK